MSQLHYVCSTLGSQVLVIRTPKGIYIRTMDGKIFAVRTASQMAAAGISPEEMNAIQQPQAIAAAVSSSSSSSAAAATTSAGAANEGGESSNAASGNGDEEEDEESGSQNAQGGETTTTATSEDDHDGDEGESQGSGAEAGRGEDGDYDDEDEIGGGEGTPIGNNGGSEADGADASTEYEDAEEFVEDKIPTTTTKSSKSSRASKASMSKLTSLSSLTSEEAMSIAKALTDVTKSNFLTPSSSSPAAAFRSTVGFATNQRSGASSSGIASSTDGSFQKLKEMASMLQVD